MGFKKINKVYFSFVDEIEKKYTQFFTGLWVKNLHLSFQKNPEGGIGQNWWEDKSFSTE